MAYQSKIYTSSIKKILLDNIDNASKSILIAMAWFTDSEIKDRLIEKKKQIPEMVIESLWALTANGSRNKVTFLSSPLSISYRQLSGTSSDLETENTVPFRTSSN